MTDFLDRYGPCAVIVGGSYGVGGCFAERLASQGFDLILAARNAETLNVFADELRTRHPGIHVDTVVADLSQDAGVKTLVEAAANREIGLFVHNAGTGSRMTPFLEADVGYDIGLVELNIVSMMKLVYHFGQMMRERRRGGIILLGSLAGLHGQYGLVSYSASKSFSRVFAEGLWFELRPHGVDVLALTLGGTETPSRQRDFPQVTGTGMDPYAVVDEALANIANGPVYFPSQHAAKANEIRALDYAEAVQAAYDRNSLYRS